MRTFFALALAALAVSVTATFASDSVDGGNPCENPLADVQMIQGVTAGTSLTKVISGVAAKQIYICSLNIQGVSGTTPTFSISYGTGANCAVGTTSALPAIATVANTLLSIPKATKIPAGKDLCYLDGGTTPVQNYMISYVQK